MAAETHTGTSAYKLSVDSSGNIIETSIGSGAVDGAGTANYISKWTDGDTIGNSIVYNHAYGVIINATSTSSYATNRQVFEVRGTAGTGAFDGGITNLTASSNTKYPQSGPACFYQYGQCKPCKSKCGGWKQDSSNYFNSSYIRFERW